MSDTVIASVVGALSVLLSVWIGWLLNRWTVNHTVKQQEFYKAAATFRVAFTDEYRTLKAVVRPDDVANAFVQTTLANVAAKHENAFILFRPYLSEKGKRQFDQAWRDYLCPEGGEVAALPSHFIDYCAESPHDLEVSLKLALEKLDRLMAFANPV